MKLNQKWKFRSLALASEGKAECVLHSNYAVVLVSAGTKYLKHMTKRKRGFFGSHFQSFEPMVGPFQGRSFREEESTIRKFLTS